MLSRHVQTNDDFSDELSFDVKTTEPGRTTSRASLLETKDYKRSTLINPQDMLDFVEAIEEAGEASEIDQCHALALT